MARVEAILREAIARGARRQVPRWPTSKVFPLVFCASGAALGPTSGGVAVGFWRALFSPTGRPLLGSFAWVPVVRGRPRPGRSAGVGTRASGFSGPTGW